MSRSLMSSSGALAITAMVIISVAALGFAFLGFLTALGEQGYGGIPHDKTTETYVRDGRQFPVNVGPTKTRTEDVGRTDAQPQG